MPAPIVAPTAVFAVDIVVAATALPPIAILYNTAPALPAAIAPAAYWAAKIPPATGPRVVKPTIAIVAGKILAPTALPIVAPITAPDQLSLLPSF